MPSSHSHANFLHRIQKYGGKNSLKNQFPCRQVITITNYLGKIPKKIHRHTHMQTCHYLFVTYQKTLKKIQSIYVGS